MDHRDALDQLGITGAITPDDLLGHIFGNFHRQMNRGRGPRFLRYALVPFPVRRCPVGRRLHRSLGSTADPPPLDFGKGGVESYFPNDGVMGGRSIGVVDYSRKTLTWAGTVSLENNGGFSSVRSEWGDRDLSGFTSVTFRCAPPPGRDDFTLTMNPQQWWPLTGRPISPRSRVGRGHPGLLELLQCYDGRLAQAWAWGAQTTSSASD